ncbi:MAG: (Fe-S)-binding protein, partial [Planctomycetota bacterium]|nr:(Fe-S)-binding protein [Planctomycetota bacterium]
MSRHLDQCSVVMFSTAESVTRDILGNIPSWLIVTFYLLVMAACGIACTGFLYRLFSVHLKGASDQTDVVVSWRGRLASVCSYIVLHRQLLRDRYAGFAHLLTLYGFVILFIGTVLVFLEHQTPLHFFYGRFYLVSSLIIDLGGVAFLVGLGMFLWRRMVAGNVRILREWWVTTLVVTLLGIGLSGFAVEATRIAQDFPEFEIWSVAGYSLAKTFAAVGIRGETAAAWHRFSWSLHAVLCIAFFALLPWRFFSHMVYSLVSWTLRSTAPKSQLTTIAIPYDRGQKPPGVTHWNEFTFRDLLQIDACTTCGRCNDVCPAHAAGKPLTPREIVLGVRTAINSRHTNGNDLAPWIADNALWSCTTCAACNDACPVGIDVYGKIIDLRRGRVESGLIPDAAETVFENSAVDDNPFQKSNDDRMNWGQGLAIPVAAEQEQIELLYWIGCSGCFDPEGQSVSRAMIKILNHLGIRYRVLGKNERCTGDPARR